MLQIRSSHKIKFHKNRFYLHRYILFGSKYIYKRLSFVSFYIKKKFLNLKYYSVMLVSPTRQSSDAIKVILSTETLGHHDR